MSRIEKLALVAYGALSVLETLASIGTVIVVFGELVHWWDWL